MMKRILLASALLLACVTQVGGRGLKEEVEAQDLEAIKKIMPIDAGSLVLAVEKAKDGKDKIAMEIAKYLIENCDKDAVGPKKLGEALWHAANDENLALVNALIQKGTGLDSVLDHGHMNMPTLLVACQNNQGDKVVQALVQAGAKLCADKEVYNAKKKKNVAVHCAIRPGFIGTNLGSALWFAARAGNFGAVQAILAKADEKCKNVLLNPPETGEPSPLDVAFGRGSDAHANDQVAELLVKEGIFYDNWQAALFFACANGFLETVKAIFASHKDKIDLKFLSKEQNKIASVTIEIGDTPLHVAALSGNPDLVIFLLQQGADRTIKNAKEQTPVELVLANSEVGKVFAGKFESKGTGSGGKGKGSGKDLEQMLMAFANSLSTLSLRAQQVKI
jgi:ankyrin repeat protein